MTDLDKLFDALRGIVHTPEQSEAADNADSAASESQPYLIVGLGNPGKDYRDTRHNIGFMLVDRLAERLNLSFTRTQFKALITDGRSQNQRIYLAKPQTFMNASGQAVGALVKFYKIPLKNLLIAYDDVDLPFDTIRMKPSGGSAGHKGMTSIIQQLGTPDFPRLRLGVGRSFGSRQAADYVLKPFSKEESEFLTSYLDRAADAALAYLREGIQQAMTEYNRSSEP
ncbi:MAG TPA: aminoacyl-tRNA hydrolase [Chloroflexi bacterium]|nr:aminoacyl-tRNA hydrolase [Chloroflexota bacterium]